ncbi:unnamed protein product [Owenia fusiformis]|uniref:Receptor ligand binding region domain-containing protein n=1 Tax=Owenia fusiformis TaxID=6347 RepID=A0A8S4NB00_OWEFU|nr:unnamed protein product [Owenia fusiformis]
MTINFCIVNLFCVGLLITFGATDNVTSTLKKRDTILIGNLIFSSYGFLNDACKFAEQAVLDVNNAANLFPLFRLELDQCLPNDSVVGVNTKLWDYIYRGHDTPFILIPWIDEDTTIPVCAVWGCIVNSIGMQSDFDAKTYKYYTKAVAENSDVSLVFDAIIQHFKWEKMGIITANNDIMPNAASVFREKLAERNIESYADVLFASESHDVPDVIWEPLKGLRIFVSFALLEVDFAKVLCKLHELGLYGRHHVLLAFYYPFATLDLIDKANHGCNSSQALEVLEGAIVCSQFVSTTLGIFTGHRHFSTNKTYDDLAHILKPTTPSTARHYQALLYDNMWAIALAINTTIQKYGIDEVKNYKHNSDKNKTLLESLYKNLLEEDFDGVSGL